MSGRFSVQIWLQVQRFDHMIKVRATFTVLEGKMAKSQDARMVVVIGAMWLLLPLVCDASLQCYNCPYELGVYSCAHVSPTCVRIGTAKPSDPVREIRLDSCTVRIDGWDGQPPSVIVRDRNGILCSREYLYMCRNVRRFFSPQKCWKNYLHHLNNLVKPFPKQFYFQDLL